MTEKRWGGEEGEGGGEAKVLKVFTFNDWKIDRLRDWRPPRNGCSSSDNCFWRWLASLALRLEKKRRPFFTSSGERRKAEILVSMKVFSVIPRNVALVTTLCTWPLTLIVAVELSWGKRQGSTTATKAAALVTPRWCTSTIASATERRSRILNWRFCCQ